jgi:RNA polymerase sigma-70 factor (ECF subfamily)
VQSLSARREPPVPAPPRVVEEPPAGRPSVPAVEALWRQYFRYAWRALRALGVPDASLDDAVQDVFVVVHRRLGDFEGRSTVRTWLFGIVARVAADHRRRAQRDRRAESIDESLADPRRADPFDRTASAEAARLMMKLLDNLDEDKREVFVLAEIEQMTAPEIAEALGLKVNTVYSRGRAAREQFERAVARYRLLHGARNP